MVKYLFRVSDARPDVTVHLEDGSVVSCSRWYVPGCSEDLHLVLVGTVIGMQASALVVRLECNIDSLRYVFEVAAVDLLAEVPDLVGGGDDA